MVARNNNPISVDDFARLMRAAVPDGFPDDAPFAVAVSGGGDSMALAWLLRDWCAQQGRPPLHVLTVDHGLRAEAAAEARQVADLVTGWGCVHRTLVWCGDKPSTRVQEEARAARYRLMSAYCRDMGVRYLFLAHHADDQAETFLFRLAKGSGLDGLCGMSPYQPYDEFLTLVRPLLFSGHNDLLATCQAHNISWIDDPSNVSKRFARGRLRAAKAVLEQEGLTAERLSVTALRFARVLSLVDELVEKSYKNEVLEIETDRIVFSLSGVLSCHKEIVIRLFQRAISHIVGEGGYPPRLQRLEALVERFLTDKDFHGGTIGGVIVRIYPSRNHLVIVRE